MLERTLSALAPHLDYPKGAILARPDGTFAQLIAPLGNGTWGADLLEDDDGRPSADGNPTCQFITLTADDLAQCAPVLDEGHKTVLDVLNQFPEGITVADLCKQLGDGLTPADLGMDPEDIIRPATKQ